LFHHSLLLIALEPQTTSATRKKNIMLAKKMHLDKFASVMADGEGLVMFSKLI
jgi:hypothetical protein